MQTKLLLLPILTLASNLYANSAAWNLNPATGDWNTAANWTPASVPNGPDDVATFGISRTPFPNVSAATEVNTIEFEPGASAFTIASSSVLTISGTGITNSSGQQQQFTTAGFSEIVFAGGATAGDAMLTNLPGLGQTLFGDTATAGSASITNSASSSSLGGWTQFFGESTAGTAVITNEGNKVSDLSHGGQVFFYDLSTADNATLIANSGGGFVGGAFISFYDDATAGNATIIVKGDLTDSQPGRLDFRDSSTGGAARIELFDKGTMLCTFREGAPLTVGSIEGDGFITLEDNEFLVGSDNLNTTFSGIIDDAGAGGSLTKIGNGTLVFRNAHTYAGGTKVRRGSLIVNNTGGSGTGSGPVQVSAGKFGGTGIVTGPVTIGTGGNHTASLVPGDHGTGSFTVLNTLTFGTNGEYAWNYDSRTFQADGVTATLGVTIQSGATFSPRARGATQLPLGTVYTAINNTAATPIAGTFANLADGVIITVGANNFQANYDGGDGNDLTLTVVP